MPAVVSGTYVKAGTVDTPDWGWISFQLMPAAVRESDSSQVTDSEVRVYLDDAGSFSLTLVSASDLTGVEGTPVYCVRERVGGLDREWFLSVPDDTPLDLPSRYPGDTVAPGTVVVAGPPGPQGPQGPPGETARIVNWFGESKTPADLPPDGILPAGWDRPDMPVQETEMLDGWGLTYTPEDVGDPDYGNVYMWQGDPFDVWTNMGNLAGPPGPAGQDGADGVDGAPGADGADGVNAEWWSGTQAEYDAIPSPDPQTIYVIVPG